MADCPAAGAADEAQRLAEEARVIAERSEYVLQGADARLELARLALARGDEARATGQIKGVRYIFQRGTAAVTGWGQFTENGECS